MHHSSVSYQCSIHMGYSYKASYGIFIWCFIWDIRFKKTIQKKSAYHINVAYECIISTRNHTGWRRPIGCLKLQVSFRKRATYRRALLRKMTSKNMAYQIMMHSYALKPFESKNGISLGFKAEGLDFRLGCAFIRFIDMNAS